MLLAYIDGFIITDVESDRDLVTAIIMNRNRVAKFLGLPTRKFRREKEECPTSTSA